MAQVIISLNASNNLARIRNFYDEAVDNNAMAAINQSLKLLISHPEIGRPVKGRDNLRERVIKFGTSGFIALYRFEKQANEVVILSICHQREAGYRDELRLGDS